MAKERELKVVILGDASSAQNALQRLGLSAEAAAKAVGHAGTKMTEAGAKTAAAGDRMRAAAASFDRVGSKMADMGRKATAFISLPIAAGFALATKAASDLSEQTNKATVVFGDASAAVLAFAKDASTSLGQSQRAALEAAGTYGNLFRAIGLTEQKSAEMSKRLLTLGADLASFNNANPEEVFLALRAGLVGETEPLRKFGINLNDARLRAEALNLGLYNGKGVLDSNAKAQAAYSLILKDTTLAQGDFARTSDGLANKTRILKARLEDTGAELGTKLIPFALKAADVALGLANAFGSLDGATQGLVLVSAGLLAALGPVLAVVGNVTKAVGGLTKAIVFLATSSATAKVALTGLGLSIAGIAAGYVAYKVAVDAINSANDKFNDNAAVAVNNAALFDGATKETAKGLKEQAVQAYISAAALNTHSDVQKGAAVVGKAMSDEQEKARVVLARLAETTGVSRERIVELANSMGINLGAASDEAKSKLAAAIAEVGRAVTPTERLASVQDTLASSTSTAAEAFDAFAEAVDAALGVVLDEREAAIALAEKVADLGESIKANGTQTGLATEQQRSLTSSLIDVVRAAEAEVEAVTKSGQVSTDAAAQKGALIQRLEEVKRKYPQLSGAIDEYIAKINSIPEAPTTTPKVDTTQATAALINLIAKANQVQTIFNRTLTVDSRGNTTVSQTPVRVQHDGGEVLHAGGVAGHTADRKLASDEVPTILQRGEYVVQKRAVQRIGIPALERLNRSTEQEGTPDRFHLGGHVQRTVGRKRERLSEDNVPLASQGGAELVDFRNGTARYVDGTTFDNRGWHARGPGGLRFNPAVRLDPSQVVDLRGRPDTTTTRVARPQSEDEITAASPARPRLAYGGIVRATPGGVDVTVAEGGRDEAIVPLPRGPVAAPAQSITVAEGAVQVNLSVQGEFGDYEVERVRLALRKVAPEFAEHVSRLQASAARAG